MNIKYHILLAVTLVLTCCSNKIETDRKDNEVFSLELLSCRTKVTIGPESAGQHPMMWQKGDAVIVNGDILSNPLGNEYDGQDRAVFTTSQKVFYPVSVVYPATVFNAKDRIEIPASQNVDNNSFANGYSILIGYASKGGSPIAMQQACGYIKFSLTGSATLSSVDLKALDCELLAGIFSVDAANGTITPVSGETGSSTISKVCSATLSGTPMDFIFAVPAGDYNKGFKLIVKDNAGQTMSKTLYTASGKAVEAGMMTKMSSVQYVPGAPESEIFAISKTSVSFPGKDYSSSEVFACAGDEEVTVSSSGLEWCSSTLPTTIPAGRTVSMSFIPSNANICDLRNGTVTFTGKTSGKTTVLTLSQSNLYVSSYGFPAKWFTPDITATMKTQWLKEGYTTCTAGNGVGKAFLSLSSTVSANKPTPVDHSGNIAGSGMKAGDYFQFSVPVQNVPAGTDLDFMVTLSPSSSAAPKYWLVEWYDGGEWKSQPRYTASEDGKTQYSFYIKYFSSSNYRTHIENYTLQNAVNEDFVRVRVRAVGSWNNGGGTLGNNTANVFFAPGNYVAGYFVCYADEATPVSDTHKMSQYGNSITYYHGSAFMLKEIARREGHNLDVRINLKGSQEFEHHLNKLIFSQEITAEGGYDFAVMNDGSYFHAEYGAGSKSAIVGVTPKYSPEEILYWQTEMTKAIKAVSPSCQTIITSEHSYSRKAADDNYLGFGSFENFDYYQWKGSTELGTADTNLNWMAPAGKGFARARNNYGFGSSYNYMQHTDNYHPNLYGAYMRACITYLIMFGGSFGENPADCCLPSAEAANLRQAAMDIVNDSTREDFHFHK